MNKFIKISGVFLSTFAIMKSVYADEAPNPFITLDTSIDINAGIGNINGIYSNIGGIEISGLARNIFIDGNLHGMTSLWTQGLNQGQPSQNSMDVGGGLKVGYSNVFYSQLNIIPYVGLTYDDNAIDYTVNGAAVFNSYQKTLAELAGVKSEFAIGNSIKLSLDSNYDYETQTVTAPISAVSFADTTLHNSYITMTPASQINPLLTLNIEAYYQYVIPLSSEQISDDYVYQGYSSSALINQTYGPQNIVGLKVGMLF